MNFIFTPGRRQHRAQLRPICTAAKGKVFKGVKIKNRYNVSQFIGALSYFIAYFNKIRFAYLFSEEFRFVLCRCCFCVPAINVVIFNN